MTANASSVKSAARTGPKNCGLLIFPGRLPQAPSERQSAAPLLLPFNCVTSVTPFPQKSQTLAFKFCERMPPPKPTLTAVSEPDPIYPYLPFLFCFPLWQRPCQQGDMAHLKSNNELLLGFLCDRMTRDCARTDTSVPELHNYRTTTSVPATENRSV